MPEDADFNCGVNDGRTSVNEYADKTRGAHGAIDFWGNVWEWTSTQRESLDILGVKGGSWKSAKTDCRTEYRKEGRNKNTGYEDVGFRVIQVLNGKEPEQKAGLYTLDAPNVTTKTENGSVLLSWNKVNNAVEYQIFEYNEETKLFKMLDRITETSYKVDNDTANMQYIVQALSYTAISDNVYPNNEIQNSDDNTIKTDIIEENINNNDKNNYIYYVICGIGLVVIISGIFVAIKKNEK